MYILLKLRRNIIVFDSKKTSSIMDLIVVFIPFNPRTYCDVKQSNEYNYKDKCNNIIHWY